MKTKNTITVRMHIDPLESAGEEHGLTARTTVPVRFSYDTHFYFIRNRNGGFEIWRDPLSCLPMPTEAEVKKAFQASIDKLRELAESDSYTGNESIKVEFEVEREPNWTKPKDLFGLFGHS